MIRIMKSKFLLVGLFTFFISCGLEDAGKSQCAIDVEDTLDSWQTTYNIQMTEAVDSEGNSQSLEACLIRKGLTEEYIQSLKNRRGWLNSNGGCTADEKSTLNSRINNRVQELEEDMESTWNRCEEVYGSGG
jgi:hypothetical protein